MEQVENTPRRDGVELFQHGQLVHRGTSKNGLQVFRQGRCNGEKRNRNGVASKLPERNNMKLLDRAKVSVALIDEWLKQRDKKRGQLMIDAGVITAWKKNEGDEL